MSTPTLFRVGGCEFKASSTKEAEFVGSRFLSSSCFADRAVGTRHLRRFDVHPPSGFGIWGTLELRALKRHECRAPWGRGWVSPRITRSTRKAEMIAEGSCFGGRCLWFVGRRGFCVCVCVRDRCVCAGLDEAAVGLLGVEAASRRRTQKVSRAVSSGGTPLPLWEGCSSAILDHGSPAVALGRSQSLPMSKNRTLEILQPTSDLVNRQPRSLLTL